MTSVTRRDCKFNVQSSKHSSRFVHTDLYVTLNRPIPPKKCPLPWGYIIPLAHPTRHQSASRFNLSFFQNSRSLPTVGQTDRTNKGLFRYQQAAGYIHVSATRPNYTEVDKNSSVIESFFSTIKPVP